MSAEDAATVAAVDVNAVARILMAAWEEAEGKPVNVSYVATFADMARALLAAPPIAQALAAVEAVARVEALADEWSGFEHDAVSCTKHDCGDCTMLNAICELRAAITPKAGTQ